MGIPEFWKVLEPALSTVRLKELTLQESLRRRSVRGQKAIYRVGVDAGVWLYQIMQSTSKRGFNSGPAPELRTLFDRLAQYHNMALHLVIVFDGTDRPSSKRGKKVHKRVHWMVEAAQKMIDGFGFEYIQSPGEAEATLAHMNAEGYIDAVLSNDSDSIIFGAHTVITNPDFKKTQDQVKIFRSSKLVNHTELSPLTTRGARILYAVLCGCDYDLVGLAKCGRETAKKLIQHKELCNPLSNFSPANNSSVTLDHWRQVLVTKLTHHRLHSLSNSVPEDFPDPKVVDYLLHPVICSDATLQKWYTNSPTKYNNASLSALQDICESYLKWSPAVISSKFSKLVWPGIVLRAALDSIEGASRDVSVPRPPRAKLTSLPIKKRKTINGITHSVFVIDTTKLVQESASRFRPIFQSQQGHGINTTLVDQIRVAVPFVVLSETSQSFLDGALTGRAFTPLRISANQGPSDDASAQPIASSSSSTRTGSRFLDQLDNLLALEPDDMESDEDLESVQELSTPTKRKRVPSQQLPPTPPSPKAHLSIDLTGDSDEVSDFVARKRSRRLQFDRDAANLKHRGTIDLTFDD